MTDFLATWLKVISSLMFCVYFSLKFIIDHIAKPYIKDGIIDGWKDDITEIAKYPNVYCKL